MVVSEDGTYIYLSPPDLRTHVMTAHPRLSMNQYMYALGALTLGQGVQALAQYEGQQQDSQDGSVVSCLHAIAKRLENPAPAPASAAEAVLKKPKQSKYEEILQEAIDAIQAPDGCGFIEFCKLASTYLQIAKYYHVAKASYSDERKIPGTDVIISAGKMPKPNFLDYKTMQSGVAKFLQLCLQLRIDYDLISDAHGFFREIFDYPGRTGAQKCLYIREFMFTHSKVMGQWTKTFKSETYIYF